MLISLFVADGIESSAWIERASGRTYASWLDTAMQLPIIRSGSGSADESKAKAASGQSVENIMANRPSHQAKDAAGLIDGEDGWFEVCDAE
jgi:hypothetical protein